MSGHRFLKENTFIFSCHVGAPCSNACCADANIVLTPSDILKLKNDLGLNPGESLSVHTVSRSDENLKCPAILPAMNDDEKKRNRETRSRPGERMQPGRITTMRREVPL